MPAGEFRQVLRRIVSFLGVGAVATLGSYVIFLLLAPWLGQGLAYAVGYVAGLPVAVLGNLRLTFAARASVWRVAAMLGVYLATAAWVALAVRGIGGLGVPAYASGAIGTGLAILSNFVGLSWVNRDRTGNAAGA